MSTETRSTMSYVFLAIAGIALAAGKTALTVAFTVIAAWLGATVLSDRCRAANNTEIREATSAAASSPTQEL